MLNKMIIVCVVLFIVPSASVAGELSYACKVSHVYELSADGSLEISNWEKTMKGSIFSVSRVTGQIIGAPLTTELANSTKVINIGNKEYAFKAIAFFDSVNKPFSSGTEDAESTAKVQVLEIQEFYDGDIKPFVAMSMSGAGIVTGTCE